MINKGDNMYTRKQYLNKECSFEDYYSQFITGAVRHNLTSRKGFLDKLAESKEDNFSDVISLEVWDSFDGGSIAKDKMKECGDYLTQSGKVCVYKLAARQMLKERG